MSVPSTTIISFLLIISMALVADAQFFFPFGNGMAQIPAAAPQQIYSGYGSYGYNGVKDSEGFFGLCKGWTCNSST